MEYYTSKIQLRKSVINDVFSEITENKKMLVFGLGYDSQMWYEGNNKNTFFVENKDFYIQLNIKNIPTNNIIKYDYKTTCSSSVILTDNEINNFIIPERIVNEGPFDIIIIDGPEGMSSNSPGRLIPCYWSTKLSKPGTLIYLDDTNRPLENFCIQKYFKDFSIQKIDNTNTVKIFI
jgi:hypothetical protein